MGSDLGSAFLPLATTVAADRLPLNSICIPYLFFVDDGLLLLLLDVPYRLGKPIGPVIQLGKLVVMFPVLLGTARGRLY